MSRPKMNWTWLGDPPKKKGRNTIETGEAVRVIIYTTFVTPGTYRVRIMTGEENTGPRDPPRWTGTATHCKSHMDACNSGIKWAENQTGLKEWGARP